MTKHHIGLDYLRTFIIVMVVAHHSCLAYTGYARFDPVNYLLSTAPIVDVNRWLGFDLFILFNDVFFMSLLFFISGLFVWSSIVRKGTTQFLRSRAMKLGIPFILIVVFLMPLAFYPSYLMTGKGGSYWAYWWQGIVTNQWPVGPLWFIWMLLLFDFGAALLHRYKPDLLISLSQRSAVAVKRPGLFYAVLVAASAIVYIPSLLIFGNGLWISLGGPLVFQASRFLHYTVYFFAGVVVGVHCVNRSLLSEEELLAKRWKFWIIAALAIFLVVVVLQVALFQRPSGLSLAARQSIYGLAVVLSCSATAFGFLAFFLRFAKKRTRVMDNLADNAYAIYLVHYVFVIWIQFSLLNVFLPALGKACIVFTGTLLASWLLCYALRRIPAVNRIV
ncbi:MAG: acyltransferase [Smithellaceae bacterium]|jgi:surface polysaccharide O-acyltransferase-like enzyme